MPLNPLAYTESVVSNFLRYQLTAYPFADPDLYRQMRQLLSLEESRRTPLLRGPYISLSQAFRQGSSVRDLVADDILHQHMVNLVPYPRVYAHQEMAMRTIAARRTALVSTGTGSGKTESFLYPIISRCQHLRDENAPPWIVAVLVYPMNALAEDQLGRLRGLLAGTRIPFAMYVGKTPEKKSDITAERLPNGSSRADYEGALASARNQNRPTAVCPPEERCSREEIRTPGLQPRILLTNVKQLELLLTRQSDIELFNGSRLEYLVFDEAHTYSGSAGAETACLIRRLRSFCGRTPEQTICVATSATLADRERTDAGKDFAARFFGVSADSVDVITEQYEPDLWARPGTVSDSFPGEVRDRLRSLLEALNAAETGPAIAAWARDTLRLRLDPADWEGDLHRYLASNEVVFQIADTLKARARPMGDLVEAVSSKVGRTVPEEEILCWLLLGAAARRGDRPLLRPVVHAFLRGVAGAVITFPDGSHGPKLWLSAEDEERERDDELVRLHVLTCNTCGQHYFEHWLADFQFTRSAPDGGEAIEGGGRIWRSQDAANGGQRAILFDRLIGDDEDDEPAKTAVLLLCRHCGAAHPQERSVCAGCGQGGGLVPLRVVAQDEQRPGALKRCFSCGSAGRAFGGLFRDPARPVRAVAVADVHVLAQEMLRHAERQRLLVFADNRQEAAFQAGWMRDHARRFRLRALMWERLKAGSLGIGDLVAHLARTLEADDELSESLLPEVWEQYPKGTAPLEHEGERKLFLRIQVLREAATSARQRLGLEPWGRMRVQYDGLSPEAPVARELAGALNVEPQAAADGIASLLDYFRRSLILLDREQHIFSRFWMDGAPEISRGYLPQLRGVPQGLKLQRAAGDDEGRVKQWIGPKDSVVKQILRKWNVKEARFVDVATQLWDGLVAAGILVPVTLRGGRGRALPRCAGTFQIDGDRLRLETHAGLWRCRKCRRAQPRPSLFDKCLAWRCDGLVAFEPESADSYDLRVLDDAVVMMRPREHSAQVPPDERDRIERQFKGDGDGINVLVCTPTLELGVDIGSLDTVLMRNVPPLPANYWQRAGRAGRRHRMAVNVTYARPATHDRAYFADPIKMLHGSVEPPRFNLKNGLMVRKHVHAVVLTHLHQLRGADSGLTSEERRELNETLDKMLPRQIRHYLFDEAGHVRSVLFSVGPLGALIQAHEARLLDAVSAAFAQGWPAEDAAVVAPEQLRSAVRGMADALQEVVRRLKRRLDWALGQIDRLNHTRLRRGTLEADEEALFNRCNRLIKRLKGELKAAAGQAEGYDGSNTYGVLAAEGFLPGYGLEIGSIRGTAQMPRFIRGARDYELPRPPAVALREYVPGNLIYANNHRFVPRFYHLNPTQVTVAGVDEPLRFLVDSANQAVTEMGADQGGVGAGIGAETLRAVPISDVDLAHQSTISDDEEYRFQLAVAVFGYEQGRHGGGVAYRWGQRAVHFRKALHARLVNVGPFKRMSAGTGLGYPVCLVCGQTRSPFASDTELEHFKNEHRDRCGREVQPTGFYADVIADASTIKDCESPEEAYSLAEALRIGASQILDMDREDLEVLVIRQPGSQFCDATLYDPMPGGSGLLEQLCARFAEVGAAAAEVVKSCPAVCEASCIDCLQTFRNAFYHRYLNRHAAESRFREWGTPLTEEHRIPAVFPTLALNREEMPVNRAEALLRHWLTRAGLPEPTWHKVIELGRPLNSTRPDCFWEVEDEPGLCLYLDGLSGHIHGNPATREIDLQIRETLRSQQYEVIVITATQLYDRAAMVGHFQRIARILIGRERAREVKADSSWYLNPDSMSV